MRCDLTKSQIADYTTRQLNSFFPDGNAVGLSNLEPHLGHALDRVDRCFSRINRADYSDNDGSRFDVLHSDQYCAYLYLLSNTIHNEHGDDRLATKVFYLNKALHSFNCMYSTQLPEVFWLVHCIGIVLGKTSYGNRLIVFHNATVGAARGEYPALGDGVVLSAGSSIIGKCVIGNNVVVAANCSIYERDIPNDTIVASGSELVLKTTAKQAVSRYFRDT